MEGLDIGQTSNTSIASVEEINIFKIDDDDDDYDFDLFQGNTAN